VLAYGPVVITFHSNILTISISFPLLPLADGALWYKQLLHQPTFQLIMLVEDVLQDISHSIVGRIVDDFEKKIFGSFDIRRWISRAPGFNLWRNINFSQSMNQNRV
jgi:hypothetical protein